MKPDSSTKQLSKIAENLRLVANQIDQLVLRQEDENVAPNDQESELCQEFQRVCNKLQAAK